MTSAASRPWWAGRQPKCRRPVGPRPARRGRDAALVTCTFLDGEDPGGACERLMPGGAGRPPRPSDEAAVEAFLRCPQHPEEVPPEDRFLGHHTCCTANLPRGAGLLDRPHARPGGPDAHRARGGHIRGRAFGTARGGWASAFWRRPPAPPRPSAPPRGTPRPRAANHRGGGYPCLGRYTTISTSAALLAPPDSAGRIKDPRGGSSGMTLAANRLVERPPSSHSPWAPWPRRPVAAGRPAGSRARRPPREPPGAGGRDRRRAAAPRAGRRRASPSPRGGP